MKDEFTIAFSKLLKDDRITVWHVSIYMAVFFLWQQHAFENPVSITRREIMELAHIRSIATYHKCIKQLNEFGYLGYFPSYNPMLGSQVFLSRSIE